MDSVTDFHTKIEKLNEEYNVVVDEEVVDNEEKKKTEKSNVEEEWKRDGESETKRIKLECPIEVPATIATTLTTTDDANTKTTLTNKYVIKREGREVEKRD